MPLLRHAVTAMNKNAEAIDFCLQENLSCAKAAQRLGLHPSILSSWLWQYRIELINL